MHRSHEKHENMKLIICWDGAQVYFNISTQGGNNAFTVFVNYFSYNFELLMVHSCNHRKCHIFHPLVDATF